MSSKYVTYSLSAIFFLVGAALYFLVPKFNEMYSQMYFNWDSLNELPFKAFHWPSFIWLSTFSLISIAVLFLSKLKQLRKVNIVTTILFILTSLILTNWLTGYIFCHSWGCSKLLPI